MACLGEGIGMTHIWMKGVTLYKLLLCILFGYTNRDGFQAASISAGDGYDAGNLPDLVGHCLRLVMLYA
jgi:hypothetical protein